MRMWNVRGLLVFDTRYENANTPETSIINMMRELNMLCVKKLKNETVVENTEEKNWFEWKYNIQCERTI